MTSTRNLDKMSRVPDELTADKGISFRNYSQFRRKILSSFKFCKLRGQISLRLCECKFCSSIVNEKCTCLECDLEEEMTLYFYYQILKKLLEYFQVKVEDFYTDENNPSFRWKIVEDTDEELNKVVSFAIQPSLQLAEVSNIQFKKVSPASMKKKTSGIEPAALNRRSSITEGKRTTFRSAKQARIVNNEISAKEIVTEKKSGSQDDYPSAKLIKLPQIGLQPITEDELIDLEKLTTDLEYNWLVKRDETYARLTFKNGNIYEGDVVDKVPQGNGTFWWSDGTVYEGQFEDGAPTGKGKMLLPDLTEYTGEFYKGYFHGHGVYNIRSTNMVYTGGWKYGKKHGAGWLLYEPGVWYEGEFENDLRHGKGFFQFADGSCYEGSYTRNKREGHGAMRWPNNDIYIGLWSVGIFNGFGEYSWKTIYNKAFAFPVQHYYKGSWVEGKRTGEGLMFFGTENGAKMVGVFQDNFKHGAAMVVCGNGRSVEHNPLFHNDKPIHIPPSADVFQKHSSEFSNQQLSQTNAVKTESSSKQEPSKEYPVFPVVQILDPVNTQRKESLCNPIEIQINSSPDDIDLYFYIERALNLYMHTFDTIQFDSESSGSSFTSFESKIELSKWNLMTLTSTVPTKMNKSFLQDIAHGRSSISQGTSNMNKSHGKFQSTVKNEEKYLRNVITRHLPKLTEIYYHYACITSPTTVYFKHYMTRMFLWQLYMDIGVAELGISLVEIDELLAENPASYVESCHHPFEHIYFFQFIQSLLGTALLVHQKEREDVRSSDGLTPYIFENFLMEYIFVHAGCHKGRCLFEFKDILPMKNVYSLYLKLGEPHTARTFLNALCTRKNEEPPCYKAWPGNRESSKTNHMGHNVNAVGHNFLFVPEEEEIGEIPEEPITNFEEDDPFFRDLSKFRVLGPKVVLECLCSVCAPIQHERIICNMKYPMTFLEFYEVLICCTLLTIARFKKKKEFLRRLETGDLKSEDDIDIESGSRKESIKLRKKK